MTRIIRVALLLCIPFTALKGGVYTLNYSLPDFSFYEEQGFDRIEAKGFTFVGEPGTPELPSLYLKYIIPSTAKAESLIVLNSNILDISGQFLVYPKQPSVPSGEIPPWVPPDPSIYEADELYPDNFIEIVSQGIMDGARIVTVAIHPLQYRPQSQQLSIVTNIVFEFAFGPNTMPELRPLKRGICEQKVYDAMMRNVITNDHEIPLYYQKPILVEEKELLRSELSPPVGPSVIITDSTFFEAFQPYADWLTDQGIPTFLISPQTIYGSTYGRDEAEKIRNYIKRCYRSAGGTYFILGGVDNRVAPLFPTEVPARVCHPFSYWAYEDSAPWKDTIPCDHYFSALDGDWNADGDQVWGELEDEVDQDPEVYVGRILCSDTQEVNNWVYKALKYEKSPQNRHTNLNIAVWIDQWHMGGAIDEFPDHFIHIIAYDWPAYLAFDLLNQGYGYTNAQTHGSIGAFPTDTAKTSWIKNYASIPPSPDYDSAGLNWLTNDNEYFIHYAVSCLTGAYDRGFCIAEALTTRYQNDTTGVPIGACATIEHTRISWYPPSHWLQTYYYGLLFSTDYTGVDPLEPSSERIGVALATAKTNMPWGPPYNWTEKLSRVVCYATNLFGSPTTDAWTKTPGNFSVWHPRRIPSGSAMEFQVIVTDASTGSPISNAKVCLNKPDDVYGVGYTDANGQITFIINPKSAGTMKVTVTRLHNYDESYTQYLPSQTTCQVLYSPSGGQSSDSENMKPDHLCITHMPTLCRTDVSIKFGVPQEGTVDFAVYNIIGSRLKTITKDRLQPGYYEERIDIRNLSNGVYFMVLKQGIEKVTKKFLVVR